jgi:hypothetical protein
MTSHNEGSGTVKFRRYALAVAILVAALLAFFVPMALAQTYVDAETVYAHTNRVSGWSYWDEDWVYRPVDPYTGSPFDAYFKNAGSNTLYAYESNWYENPFHITGQFGYDRAYCGNISGWPQSPVTCIAVDN